MQVKIRLNLILQQNADMAEGVGTYFSGRDPDIEERYPYWLYVALNDARASHAAFNGKVFRKDDPIWNSIFPPRDFRCRCSVENVSDNELPNGKVSKLNKNEKIYASAENKSGFKFNPRDAFASWSQKELESTGMVFDPEELKRLDLAKDKLMGLTLRPFGDQGRNKYVTASDLGLPKLDFKDAPKLIDNQDLITLENELITGFNVESKDGSTVRFNQTLLEHWENKEEDPNAKINRIPFLKAYKETVENPDEKWDQEGQRTYIKKFINDKGKPRLSTVFVKNDSEVYSAYVERDFERVRKGLSHEEY